jgi:hypothetical protein
LILNINKEMFFKMGGGGEKKKERKKEKFLPNFLHKSFIIIASDRVIFKFHKKSIKFIKAAEYKLYFCNFINGGIIKFKKLIFPLINFEYRCPLHISLKKLILKFSFVFG